MFLPDKSQQTLRVPALYSPLPPGGYELADRCDRMKTVRFAAQSCETTAYRESRLSPRTARPPAETQGSPRYLESSSDSEQISTAPTFFVQPESRLPPRALARLPP